MSNFNSIDLNTIKVGDPITRDLWVKLKDNFDNHEFRINNLQVTGGSTFIFNSMVSFVGYSASNPYVMYYAARESFSINEFRGQLRSKNDAQYGTLTLDLEKSSNTNDVNFASILSTPLTFDFATDEEHSVKTASINSGLNDILAGEVIRIKVTSIPITAFSLPYSGEILLSVGAS